MSKSQEDSSFLGQLLAANRYASTGVITVRAENLTTFAYVLKGTPVFAEEGTLGETLGRVMLRQGVLDQQQYAKIIDRMTDSVFGSEQLRFGEVAVALGYLTLEQVNDALAEQVRQKFLHCMQWERAECGFSPNAEALDEVARYPCQIEPLVLEGFRRYYELPRLEPLWKPASAFYPALADAAEVMAARFAMTPEERVVVEAADGSRSVAELTASGLDAVRTIAALIVTQGATLHSSAAEARETAASRARVRVPAAAPAPRAPPPRPAPPPPVVKLTIKEPPPEEEPEPAHRARPSVPPSADVKRARLRAEQGFQAGKRNLRSGLLGKAVEDLDKAAALHPEAVEYQLYAAWARFRLDQEAGAVEQHRDELARLALQAVREDRNMAFAHYVHAQLLLMDGDDKGAYKSFRVAHKLDPDDVDALRHVRILARRGEG